MMLNPMTLDRTARNALMTGLVAPRPIAWVSSMAMDGSRNLAPFSFFNAFSFDPPIVCIGPGSRRGVNKDTLRNVKQSGEFVVNVVTRDMAEVANACSAEYGPEIDEIDVGGIQMEPSVIVAPPRVAMAPAALECRFKQIIEFGEADRPSNNLVIASVVQIYVADEAMSDGNPIPDALDLVGRMGDDLWCTTRDRFVLPRPRSTDPGEVMAGVDVGVKR